MAQQFKYFDQQVAGHDKLVLFPANEVMVIKPCKKRELEFYQTAQTHPSFLDFIPQCYGTLRATTEKDLAMLESSIENDLVLVDAEQEQNVCLENILHGFTRPCIMDLKVYDTIKCQYACYDKRLGRTRTEETIIEALLAYLFPSSHYGLRTEEYKSYIPSEEKESRGAVPGKYMRWIIECFIDTLEEIKEAVTSFPNLSLIGSSLLFVYEGDREAAEKTWKQMLEEDKKESKGKQVDTGEEEEEEEESVMPKMCDLRLIDFAHSDWQAERIEQDPDLVKGFDNTIQILSDCLNIQRQEKL